MRQEKLVAFCALLALVALVMPARGAGPLPSGYPLPSSTPSPSDSVPPTPTPSPSATTDPSGTPTPTPSGCSVTNTAPCKPATPTLDPSQLAYDTLDYAAFVINEAAHCSLVNVHSGLPSVSLDPILGIIEIDIQCLYGVAPVPPLL